ncbi:MAG: hypothetical protein MUC96_10930 [Myxococcaceae bacterium]|jgi:hypothetical protein|nr:hypothetical protein [Myxococcaceae bacterium]
MKLSRRFVLSSAALAVPALAQERWGFRAEPTYAEVIQRVVAMPQDADLVARAAARGLGVMNVMWEDTGRFEGSSVGPNISDLTLQVRERVGEQVRTSLLPVIRYPNFTDTTADVKADRLWVRVGNQREGAGLKAIRLTEVLSNLKEYLSDPRSLEGTGNLLARRDSHFLVSAQHVFVPLPKTGKAEFNPVLFNYQSYAQNPAVLTLLVTREGTSVRVIENLPGDQTLQGWGQQLFFNEKGQRTTFTAERKSAVANRIAAGQGTAADQGALEEGADMMMIVQVPLKQKPPPRQSVLGGLADMMQMAPAAAPMQESAAEGARGPSDVEQAVLGHGDAQGPHGECGGLALERDERFPVRVTVQFYKATSNGVVSDTDLAEVERSIKRVYSDGDFVGSLVVPASQQDRQRPTSWLERMGFRR